MLSRACIRLGGVFGALRDASPDHWGRRVIERHAGKPQLGELDYLLHSPDDRAGALGFGLNPTPPAPLAAIVDAMAERVRATWYKVARSAGVSERDCNAIAGASCTPDSGCQPRDPLAQGVVGCASRRCENSVLPSRSRSATVMSRLCGSMST
jgi:hypothetical protein